MERNSGWRTHNKLELPTPSIYFIGRNEVRESKVNQSVRIPENLDLTLSNNCSLEVESRRATPTR